MQQGEESHDNALKRLICSVKSVDVKSGMAITTVADVERR